MTRNYAENGPRHADANLMYGSVHAVRQHDG
jgi:hypothetical protein